jgi:hypothetical protein
MEGFVTNFSHTIVKGVLGGATNFVCYCETSYFLVFLVFMFMVLFIFFLLVCLVHT